MATAEHVTIDLLPFCDTYNGGRYTLGQPYYRNGVGYATDGRIGIRIDESGVADSTDDVKFPDFDKVLSDFDFSSGFEPLPAEPPTRNTDMTNTCRACRGSGLSGETCAPRTTKVECKECDGSGEVVCHHCDQDMDCEDCNGTGTVYGTTDRAACPRCEEGKVQVVRVRIGEWDFGLDYLRAIQSLPNVTHKVAAGGELLFKFDGGRGVLMPMTKED